MDRLEKFIDSLSRKPYPVIIIIVLALYFQTLFFGYVYIDDNEIIIDRYEKVGELSSIPEAFTHDAFFRKDMVLYRPMLTISLILNAAIGGKVPFVYHLTNVLLHAIVSCLIFLLFKELKYHRKTAFFAALFYAVHPAFVNPVNWIVARDGIMAAMFSIAAFITFIKFIETSKTEQYVLHVIFYGLAVFSKETSLILPAVMVVYYIIFVDKKLFKPKNYLLLGTWIGFIILFFLMRSLALKPGLETNIEFGFGAVLSNLAFIPDAVRKSILPLEHSVLPSYSTIGAIHGLFWIAMIIIVVFLNKQFKNKAILFGLLWFMIMAVPAMFIRYPQADVFFDYVDNRLYFTIIGLIIILAELIKSSWAKDRRKINAIILSAFFIFYIIMTFIHSRNYQNPETYWNNAIATNPGKAMMHYRCGYSLWRYYFDQMDDPVNVDISKFDDVIAHFEKALNLYDDRPEKRYTLKNYTDLLNQLKKYDEAYQKALKIKEFLENYPEYKSYFNETLSSLSANMIDKGAISYQNEDYERALELTKMGIEIYQPNALAYTNLGMIYDKMNRPEKAIENWQKAIEKNPEYINPYKHLLVYYINRKKYDKAAKYADDYVAHGGELDKKLLNFLKNYK